MVNKDFQNTADLSNIILPRDAMLPRYYAAVVVCPSVFPSVCHKSAPYQNG